MNFRERLRVGLKLIQLLRHSSWRHGLCHGVAATVEHLPVREMIKPRTVVDVGANKGQFALFALEAWPGCRIIAYEPLPRPAAILSKLFAGNRNVELHEVAVGSESGSATIHVSKRDDSSSLLPMSSKQVAYFPDTQAIDQREVPLVRLDEHLASASLTPPILLKVDVQGYEHQTLIGATALLPYIDSIYVETSLEELYDGQALYDQVLTFLDAAGFSMVWKRDAQLVNQRVIQEDCLFISRRPEHD